MKLNKLALKREIMQVGQKLTAETIDRDAAIEFDENTQEPNLTKINVEFWADPQEVTYNDIKNSGGIVSEKDVRLTTTPEVNVEESDIVFYNGGTYKVTKVTPKKNRKFLFIREDDQS